MKRVLGILLFFGLTFGQTYTEGDIELEVDGGINFETSRLAINAGANVLVAGTSTFKGGQDNYADNISKLRLES